jgi:hypothetical protein
LEPRGQPFPQPASIRRISRDEILLLAGFAAQIEQLLLSGASIERIQRKMLFWMFGFWSATVIPIIGVMLALSGAFDR